MKFSYDREKKEGIVIYRLIGRLFEIEDAKEMLDEFEKDIAKDEKKFVINLKSIENLNSSGLNILINIFTKARNNYGELLLADLTIRIKELLISTKLLNIFVVEPTEAAAIEKINS